MSKRPRHRATTWLANFKKQHRRNVKDILLISGRAPSPRVKLQGVDSPTPSESAPGPAPRPASPPEGSCTESRGCGLLILFCPVPRPPTVPQSVWLRPKPQCWGSISTSTTGDVAPPAHSSSCAPILLANNESPHFAFHPSLLGAPSMMTGVIAPFIIAPFIVDQGRHAAQVCAAPRA